jgi:hypothetical protein
MGLMSYIHNQLLRRGLLSDLLPDEDDLGSGDRPEREAVRAEIEVRAAEEREVQREVAAAVRRLRELDKRNHYGESLRRAFGGR